MVQHPAKVPFELEGRRVFVAGHRGMVGSALVRRLGHEHCHVLTADRAVLDLSRQAAVESWMQEQRPDIVVVAAARVGGIRANDSFPADFLYDNLLIETNLIHAAHQIGVEKLLFLGSSCIYPRDAAQPLTEDALLTGPLEATNQWYAVAKIAGIKLCQAYRLQHGRDFISAMPTNLYGYGDNFELTSSHVLPALMRKIHAAKQARNETVTIWGTGSPRREFMFVDDLADALVHLLRHYSGHDHVNVGVGTDMTINEVAAVIADTVGWTGRFVHDASQPDGTPRKLMDSSRLAALGWRAKTDIREGLQRTYRWYLDHLESARL
jgi:GDP-L-fucose synthase